MNSFQIKKWSPIVILLLILFNTSYGAGYTKSQLSGTITDLSTNERLPFATIIITSVLDSSFSIGVISDVDGDFFIEEIEFGSYFLEASFMGYEKHSLDFIIEKRKTNLEIKLQKKSYSFDELEVSAEKELIEEGIDKTTVNIKKNNTLIGGSALDAIQSLPSIDLDINGNIQYRGSNKVTILLNGKSSELVKSLDQIPAYQIEKVEINNNPSAKHEADGMSGIINIVMKSKYDELSRSSMNFYWGYPETYGTSVGYYENLNKVHYYANSNYSRKTQFQTKEHWRYNYENQDAFDYYQYDRQDQNLNNIMVNGGLDYDINSKQKIGLTIIAAGKLNVADRSINYQTWDEFGNSINDSNKDIEISLKNYVLDGNLDYEYQINNSHNLDASLHYNYLDQTQKMEFDFYNANSSDPMDHDYQNTYSDQLNQSLDFNLNHSWDITDSSLLESGYGFTSEDLVNDFHSETFSFENDNWEDDNDLGNQFHYLQNIHAAYINLESKFRYFNLQMGLRGEYTSTNQFIKAKEDYLDLFPSIRLSKRLDKYFRVFTSYNRRINRPILKMINPYTNEYADILNMHIGNPDLNPEYVNSFELGSLFSSDKNSAKVSAYYRHIDQAISRVKSATNDSALLVTFMNLEHAQLFGGELSYSLKVIKLWQINTNANIFYTALKGSYGPNKINKSHTGWTASLKNQFKLHWKLQIQFNFYYKSSLPDVLGTYMERYYTDLAISKNVMKDKGKIIFKVSDVFNTYRFGLDLKGIEENGYHYTQVNRRKNESQYFIISFVYNFKGKEKKKKNQNFFLEEYGK